MKRNRGFIPVLCAGVLGTSMGLADDNLEQRVDALRDEIRELRHDFDQVNKGIDDLHWQNRLSDLAFIDKVRIVGPPKTAQQQSNKTAQGYNNPLIFKTYVFLPRKYLGQELPLIVLPHGGVHANFDTNYAHIVRELVAQGYVVVAPEYRGSTGYGQRMYESIDYGGREIDDVLSARNYMIESYRFLNDKRVGIIGWSHGGLLSLMNVFNYPDSYAVAYAGVPVSDLIARMGYKTSNYRQRFSVDYHIGKTAYEDVEEYRRRSPAWQAHKLETPLLVHTNTSDEDVNVLEVEHLINALKAHGKKFEYEIYENRDGGHSFDRLDTLEARLIRLKMYQFIATYLSPPAPFQNLEELNQASYLP